MKANDQTFIESTDWLFEDHAPCVFKWGRFAFLPSVGHYTEGILEQYCKGKVDQASDTLVTESYTHSAFQDWNECTSKPENRASL
jgi:hypothetical protein